MIIYITIGKKEQDVSWSFFCWFISTSTPDKLCLDDSTIGKHSFKESMPQFSKRK